MSEDGAVDPVEGSEAVEGDGAVEDGGAVESSAPADGRSVGHSGYLSKQGHMIRSWKRRFFTLQAKNVFYYEGAQQDLGGLRGVGLKGAITLTGYRDISSVEKGRRIRRLELLGVPKNLTVEADDDEQFEGWVEALQAALEA